MNAGRFDRQITFQVLTRTRNNVGDSVDTWADFCKMWANIKVSQGNEIVTAGKSQADTDIIFTIRYRTDLTTAMHIVYENNTYNITGIAEITRRGYLQIAGRAAKA